LEKYKAPLVAKGYSKLKRIDFGEIFSSVRFILYIIVAFDFEVE
jgi:hypothetical protein